MPRPKKRTTPLSPLDVSRINYLADSASKLRSEHPPTHPYALARTQLAFHLQHLVNTLHYTPAQIAEETTMSYRSVKRYLNQ